MILEEIIVIKCICKMLNEWWDWWLWENEWEFWVYRFFLYRYCLNEIYKYDYDWRYWRYYYWCRIFYLEMEFWFFIYIYFNGLVSNVFFVLVYIDYVILVFSLNLFNEGMDILFDNCFELLGCLWKNFIVYFGSL